METFSSLAASISDSMPSREVNRLWLFFTRDSWTLHTVVLSHNLLTNESSIVVNGRRLKDLNFQCGERTGRVVVSRSPSVLKRMFSFGNELPSFDLYLDSTGDVEETRIPSNVEMLREDAFCGCEEISIPSVVISHNTAWYQVYSKIKYINGSKDGNIVHRRFSDFVDCRASLIAMYRGTHLMDNVPDLPPKRLKIATDHSGAEFLEHRRLELSRWLEKVVALPGAMTAPALVCDLLGFGAPEGDSLENVSFSQTETSVVFLDGPIGCRFRRLESGDFSTQIADFCCEDDEDSSSRGQAESSGRISLGDVVVRVEGKQALSQSYEELTKRIREADRPMVIHFLGMGASKSG